MKHVYYLSLMITFALFNMVTTADDDNLHEQHGAHDHSSATIEIIKDDGDWEVDIILPADIHTEFDLQTKSLQEHAASVTWVEVTPNNACNLQEIEAEIDGDHGKHEDLHIEINYQCGDVDQVSFNIFDYFPELEAVDVLFVSETQTQKHHLTKDNHKIRFK